MHGIIHAELKKYVETKHSKEAWQAVLKEAGLGFKVYMATSAYEDKDAVAIVVAASKLTGTPVQDILEDFGLFIAPDLLGMYGSLIPPEWDMMTMLLNTEDTIHRVVRMKNPGAEPPQLKFEKVAPNVLKFNYDSPRRMHAVARGILRGVAEHYKNTLEFQERPNPDGTVVMLLKIT